MDIKFESISRSGGIATVCSECGVVVIDWRMKDGDFTSERPNQDKHKAWHERVRVGWL